ncbi:MAG: chromosome partitioning protein [Dehalococcoidia bacterium]|nr:chromosome partitioning protein [Dehalococcoidia bacterium]
MRTIAFALQKGGTGKTSCSVTVAQMAAEAGHRVLMVDADPQGSASSWLLTEAPPHELADVLTGAAALADTAVPVAPGMELVPTFGIGGGLRAAADNLEGRPFHIDDAVRKPAAAAGYDLVVFDTSPANGRLERAVLAACDEVVPVLTAELFAVDGLEVFRDFVANVESGLRVSVGSPRLVLNLVNDSFRRHAAYRRTIERTGLEVYEVHQDARMPEAQMTNTALPATSRAAAPLRELASAVAGG